MDNNGGFRVELLGPVEARVDGRQVALGGQRPRALLAVLAVMRGRVVSSERLIDELWGEEPPARARETVQVNVSRLRKALVEAGGDAERLVGRAGGYVLELGPGARDVDRWEAALGRARQARAAGRFEAARTAIEEALAVWRGAPFAGVSAHELLDGERARLEEERLAATIEGIELDLELGRHGELLGQLEALVLEHPFKERLVELQMLALYRSGRQADALAAFLAARARFVEELGIEPRQALRELHEDVLRHADTLGAEPKPAWPGARGQRGLPVPPNRTIGREHDLEAIGARLRTGSVRLLTLTGPGGVGKTRLALEAARGVEQDFADGGCFVSLAALQRPDDVPAAIVTALGMVVLSGESPVQALERFLAAKRLLLVVDNFEHVLAAAPVLGGLLEVCPALTVLVTSREPLALRAEARYLVSPLALPERGILDDPEALARASAVALFCERARAHDPGFDLADGDPTVVAEICRRLDGLPLAIELAAARCGVLSVGEIAQRLQVALSALGAGPRDAPTRQQTLRATIDWSHELLDEREREGFAGFAVFAGGASVPAAETVTGADLATLERLVAKSLLVRQASTGGSTRLGMLETLRVYAGERLETAGYHAAVRERHYRVHLELAQMHGTDRALMTAGRGEHLARLDAEVDNFRVALEWAVVRPDAESALTLCAALGRYWLMRDRYAEAVRWIDAALSLPGAENHPELRVRLLCIKTPALWTLGRGAEQSAVHAEAVATARTLADPLVLSHTLSVGVDHAAGSGELSVADALADEAWHWASVAGDAWEMAQASSRKTMAASSLSELRERIERAATLLDEVGNVHQLAHMFAGVAYGAVFFGGPEDALKLVKRALPLMRELDEHYIWMMLQGNLGFAALFTGDSETADAAFREELRLCRELVVLPFASEGLVGLAALAALRGEPRRAARLVGASEAHRYGQPKDAVDARLDSVFFAEARQRCGPDTWDTEVRGGAALSFDDAISDALQTSDP